MNIKTILVPVDGSEHANKALQFAADLASKYGATLKLLHVLIQGELPEYLKKLTDKPLKEQPGMAIGAAYVSPALPPDVLEDIANNLLKQAEESAKKAGAKRVETEIAAGSAANAILDTAKKSRADLVVMGPRGLGTLEGMLVGSVSHKVQQLAECSVITVK